MAQSKKSGYKMCPRPSNSPDWAPSDYLLLPNLKECSSKGDVFGFKDEKGSSLNLDFSKFL